MAAPTPGTRPTSPSGYKMPDGFSSVIGFKNRPGISLWIQTVKFAGIDGGEKINTTTMFNVAVRTFAARQLKTLDDVTFKAAFDPDILVTSGPNSIWAAINDDSETITEFWPEGSTRAYYAYLQKMAAPEMKEGEFPTADFTITVTNWDKANQTEAIPVFTPAGGT